MPPDALALIPERSQDNLRIRPGITPDKPFGTLVCYPPPVRRYGVGAARLRGAAGSKPPPPAAELAPRRRCCQAAAAAEPPALPG